MSNRCPDCYGRTSGRGRCPDCRAEHAATTTDDTDTSDTCACCGAHAPDGDFGDDATGVWLCGPCQALDLTPRQYAALLAATPAPLGGVCEWAIGVDDAYPDADPAELEAGFESASTRRLVADGGDPMRGEHTLSADLDFETGDDWEIEDAEYAEEFRDAVETVRADHDAEVMVDADEMYQLRVRWNEPTDEIRFDVYGISEVFRLVDGGGA